MRTDIPIFRCDTCGKRLSDNEVSISEFLKQKQDIGPEEHYCFTCVKTKHGDGKFPGMR